MLPILGKVKRFQVVLNFALRLKLIYILDMDTTSAFFCTSMLVFSFPDTQLQEVHDELLLPFDKLQLYFCILAIEVRPHAF